MTEKGSLDQSSEPQLSDDIKVSVRGKLNKLQLFIDSKIGEIRKLNDQVCTVQNEVEIAQQVDIEQRAGVGYDEVVLLLLPLLLAEDQGTI